MMQVKPFSQACENNKGPILEVLQRLFSDKTSVLEIGSGSGQHAVFFADAMPHLQWQPSDQGINLPGIALWCGEYLGKNLRKPIALDVLSGHWPSGFDAVFSANTAHIMPLDTVYTMIKNIAIHIDDKGIFALYGPFKYGESFTSDSNASFDVWLKQHNPERGIRDFEKLHDCASNHDLRFIEDIPMPANNRLLVWKKQIST